LPTLSACLRHKGEITSKTLEAIVYQALKNLLHIANKKAILDAVINNGSSINDASLKVIPNQQIYDEVYKLADGSPTDKQYAFYSVDYGEVTEKKILKICRDKFLAKDTRNTKERSHEFNEDTVSNVGKTFDMFSRLLWICLV
jgi:hypothetical protein